MTKKNPKSKKPSLWRKVGTNKERDYIIENLSSLIASGVGITESFRSIQNEIRSKRLRLILDEIIEGVQKGRPIWRAMTESGIFPDSVIVLIRLGEESGRLPENLSVVAEQNRKNRSFRSKLQSAMLYPIFVLGITVVVGVGIAWFILPKLAVVFGQLKVDVPVITKIIIRIGEILGSHGIIIIPVFICLFVLILLVLFVFPKTKHLGQTLLFRAPGLGRLVREVEIARFGYLLGTLVEVGLSITESLRLLGYATQIRAYKKVYNHIYEQVSHGYSLQQSFKSFNKIKKLIPSPVQQMIVTGEQSGHLPEMLVRISVMYEEKTENTAKNVAVLLEPVLLVVVWLGVMTIALAVILPIYSILGGVR